MVVKTRGKHLNHLKRVLLEHYRIIVSNRLSATGLIFIVFFLVIAIFAPWIAPNDPWEMMYEPNEGI